VTRATLHVITALIRPENLPSLLAGIELGRTFLNVEWWIAPDLGYFRHTHRTFPAGVVPKADWIHLVPVDVAPRPDPFFGEYVVNAVLDALEGPEPDWWTFHADDNLQPPEFYAAVAGGALDPLARVLVFPQAPRERHPEGLPARPDFMRPYGVDVAQMAVRLDYLRGLRYPVAQDAPDGRFAEALWKRGPEEAWRFRDAPQVPYNALRAPGACA
jgi:hypothetical protein